MFDPVIKVFMDEMKMHHEGKILKAVQNIGVVVDKDELLKALAYDRGQYEKGFADGVKECCQRIVERLEEAKGTYIDENGKELYQEDYFIDIDDAIDIVKEEGGLDG